SGHRRFQSPPLNHAHHHRPRIHQPTKTVRRQRQTRTSESPTDHDVGQETHHHLYQLPRERETPHQLPIPRRHRRPTLGLSYGPHRKRHEVISPACCPPSSGSNPFFRCPGGTRTRNTFHGTTPVPSILGADVDHPRRRVRLIPHTHTSRNNHR